MYKDVIKYNNDNSKTIVERIIWKIQNKLRNYRHRLPTNLSRYLEQNIDEMGLRLKKEEENLWKIIEKEDWKDKKLW